jgi:hypothetical protein
MVCTPCCPQPGIRGRRPRVSLPGPARREHGWWGLHYPQRLPKLALHASPGATLTAAGVESAVPNGDVKVLSLGLSNAIGGSRIYSAIPCFFLGHEERKLYLTPRIAPCACRSSIAQPTRTWAPSLSGPSPPLRAFWAQAEISVTVAVVVMEGRCVGRARCVVALVPGSAAGGCEQDTVGCVEGAPQTAAVRMYAMQESCIRSFRLCPQAFQFLGAP